MRRRAHSSRCTTYRCAWNVLALLGALASAAVWGGEQAASVQTSAAQATGVPRELLEVERSEEEDPLAERITESVDEPRQWADTPNRLRPTAASACAIAWKMATRSGATEGRARGWTDCGSFARRRFCSGQPRSALNLLDELDLLSSPSSQTPDRQIGDSVFLRLLYVGVETENGALTFGKNWSAYYQVSKFTDQFQGAGANATGTFNAGTDGGETGTGRANRTLQARFVARPPSTSRLAASVPGQCASSIRRAHSESGGGELRRCVRHERGDGHAGRVQRRRRLQPSPRARRREPGDSCSRYHRRCAGAGGGSALDRRALERRHDGRAPDQPGHHGPGHLLRRVGMGGVRCCAA